MTRKPTDTGLRNRTGIQASPLDWRAAAEQARASAPDPSLQTGSLARVRIDLSQAFEPLGTLPAPLTVRGAVGTLVEGIQGNSLPVLMDLLGERIAYQRMGVRLYEALLCKHAAAHLKDNSPAAGDLNALRAEKVGHLGLVVNAMEELGGDATAVTPCADAMAMAARGLLQCLADPRTTFTQGLRAILLAEMGDYAGWEALVEVSECMGLKGHAAAFRQAFVREVDHVAKVKRWMLDSLRAQAT